MRRLVVLAVVLALALTLCVPAFAAESYVFEYWEPMLYSDFEKIDGEVTFLLYDAIPAGLYHGSFFVMGQEVDFGLLDVRFVPGQLAEMSGSVWETVLPVSIPGLLETDCRASLFVGDLFGDTVSILTFYDLNGDYYLRAPEDSYVRFLPASHSDTALYAASGLSTVLGVVLDVILGNWFLSLLLCLSLVGMGVAAFRKLRRSR